jgi:serine/threonine protein kinase
MDLLYSLLMLDPSKRPSARKALMHPYFEDIANILRDPPVLI